MVHARKALPENSYKEKEIGPWFTGPLLTSSGHVVPIGHANYEPYFYWANIPGEYDKHWHYRKTPPTFRSFLSQTAIQFGILPGTEIDFVPQFLYNNCDGQHMWHVADMPIAVAFQLLMDSPDTWWPAIKMRLGALIPLGKYDRLNPLKLYTDFSGVGDWAPTLTFVASKLFHFGGFHYLSWRTSAGYTFTVPVPVHGFNIWGGAPSFPGIKGTRGTVYPGCVFSILQGFEYSLTHNWALALDVQYLHINSTRFSGHSPKVLGIDTKPVAPSADRFSIAPALEYNFNANIGIITGPWFSIAGRNSNQTSAFFTWVFAINIYQ
jgi:hypothetical protein